MDLAVTVSVKVRHRGGQGAAATAAAVKQHAEGLAQGYAEDIARFARQRAPVDTGHLRDSITVVSTGPGAYQARVGAFYGVYVNYGTRNMAAQPFWEPAVNEARARLEQRAGKVFRL